MSNHTRPPDENGCGSCVLRPKVSCVSHCSNAVCLTLFLVCTCVLLAGAAATGAALLITTAALFVALATRVCVHALHLLSFEA